MSEIVDGPYPRRFARGMQCYEDSNQRSRVGYARQRNDTNQNRKEVIVTTNAGIVTTDLTPNLTCNKVSQT